MRTGLIYNLSVFNSMSFLNYRNPPVKLVRINLPNYCFKTKTRY